MPSPRMEVSALLPILIPLAVACGASPAALLPSDVGPAKDAEPTEVGRDAETPNPTPDMGGDAGRADRGGVEDFGPDAGPSVAELCFEADRFSPSFGTVIDRWVAQDARSAEPAEGLLFVGSSSIRRWEGLALAFSDYRPIQRGFGGAHAAEVAQRVDALVRPHDPRGVVLFAGTNDIADGVSPDFVVDRIRCFRARVAEALGAERPVFFVGITPTPSRWAMWPRAVAVNQAIQALAEADPGLHYIDVPTPFLARGEPPPESLFVEDRLHLSANGYALWTGIIRDAVQSVLLPLPASSFSNAFPPGTRALIDFGPSDGTHGEPTLSPDVRGLHWNNVPGRAGGELLIPGEHVPLVTTTGTTAGIELVISGGLGVNGYQDGGLRNPEVDRLQDLALATATGDYAFSVGDDLSGAVWIRGLDPSRRYTLRFFGTRDASEVRITRFVVSGARETQALLQTSGEGAGRDGREANDDDVAQLVGIAPDGWGHLFIDIQTASGRFGYLGVLDLRAE